MSEIFNNNGITLRSEKAAALSFNEMDQNFSSFFYSASAVRVNTTNKLRLFYTGSDTLDNGFEADRYMEVLLPDAAETTTTVGSSINIPGSANQIMFNTLNSSGESILGASGNFVFTNNSRVGIGLNDPNAPLTLKSTDTGIPSSVIIRANNSEDQVTNTRGYYEVNRGSTVLFRLGKTTAGGSGEGADNTHLFSKNSIDIGQSDFAKAPVRKMRITSSGVIIGDCVKTNVYPASPLTVIGELSVGLQKAAAQLGYIGGIGECDLANLLPTNSQTTGILIQSPKGAKGGVVAIGLNTDATKCESFSVLRGCQGSFDSSIATFRADGKVGIGVTNPKELFHVQGNITGSGNISAAGNLSIDGTATVRTIAAGSAASTSALVTTTAGLVQKIAASPVPVGGIIMWSGNTMNIPAGWKLCDGNNGTPDLTDKFVIGASTTYRNIAHTTITGNTEACLASKGLSGGNKNAVLIGHSHSTETTVTPNPHSHCLPRDCSDDFYDPNKQVGNVESLNHSSGTDEGLNRSCQTGTVSLEVSTTICKCGINTSNQSAAGQSGTNMNLPPYYALAFIMYVGS